MNKLEKGRRLQGFIEKAKRETLFLGGGGKGGKAGSGAAAVLTAGAGGQGQLGRVGQRMGQRNRRGNQTLLVGSCPADRRRIVDGDEYPTPTSSDSPPRPDERRGGGGEETCACFRIEHPPS